MQSIVQRLAEELSIRPQQVETTIALLDDGATVPFIARYRKEATGSLDDIQLRALFDRLRYLRELEQRREVILKSIQDQDKMDPELHKKLLAADSKTLLEDLYLPFKPRRVTKGQLAIEAGLEPLAESLLNDPSQHPETLAKQYLNPEKGINEADNALDGARFILMERFAEDATVVGEIRNYLLKNSLITSKVVAGKEKLGDKFSNYFDCAESFQKIPAHRALALLRGRNEGFLQLSLVSSAAETKDDDNGVKTESPCIGMIARHFQIKHQQRAADDWLAKVVKWTWSIKLQHHMETELFGILRERADESSIKVFADNLKDLLMAAPAGKKITMGLDPGLRTGVKVVVVDDTGKLLVFTTIFPHVPQKAWEPSLAKLKQLCIEFSVNLISIGNGTGSRETDKLVIEVLKSIKGHKIDKLVVSEAGASVYSASELASKEFPDLDVSYRGAVSIARRLQDPLAELVKIDPKSIGVGQYQHDVSQLKLSRSLEAVVEDCVNAVGVDLNTASAPLLSRVSGLNSSLASAVIDYRDNHGRFKNRQKLLEVPRLGPKAFEQAAGFLKIADGENPLDASAVHPEAYPLVEKIIHSESVKIKELLGNTAVLRKLDASSYVSEQFGLPTIKDIISELEKPGRDPRPAFKTASFKEGVESLKDLKPEMSLQGVVTNVTNFGAFVDIGVHQDGLVHISMLADRFVSDPREVVKAGDVVTVRVVEIDQQRNRVSLSMRSASSAPNPKDRGRPATQTESKKNHRPTVKKSQKPKSISALAEALGAAFSGDTAKK